MRKSKINKMKLASVLLLSTVLIPNIAYADEEIDETVETETETVTEEVENTEETEQTINEEQVTETEETADTYENTEEEAAQEVTPESDSINNNDIDTNTGTTSENIQEESTESGGSGEILQPAEPEQTYDLTEEEPAESEEPMTEVEPDVTEGESQVSDGTEEVTEDTAGEADSDMEAEPEYEDETVTDDTESDTADLYEYDESFSDETQGENTGETEVTELPLEQIEPIETVDPEEQMEEEPAETVEQPVEDENIITTQPSEDPVETEKDAVPADDVENIQTERETVHEESATAGKKKLYRYDYGDILNGISFSEESIKEDLSTLDKRVTRVMSSQIIEEKDLTAAQKIELEEKVKSEQTDAAPYDGEELPNTGEADTTNYAFAGLLSIFGAVLVFMSKKLKTDN